LSSSGFSKTVAVSELPSSDRPMINVINLVRSVAAEPSGKAIFLRPWCDILAEFYNFIKTFVNDKINTTQITNWRE
jgi:hypothetical protein